MDDDFHSPGPNVTAPPGGLLYKVWAIAVSAPPAFIIAILLAPLAIVVATRYLSERPSKVVSAGKERTVWLLPYWLPFIGHGFSFLYDPFGLMERARDLSPHSIFALNLGMTTHNIISDPSLVSNTLAQKESVVQFVPIAWAVVQKFFGIPRRAKDKYMKNWEVGTPRVFAESELLSIAGIQLTFWLHDEGTSLEQPSQSNGEEP